MRVPIVPGAFDTVGVTDVEPIGNGGAIALDGPGVLAFDGERERLLAGGASATVTVRDDGPLLIDVTHALLCAAHRDLFDVPEVTDGD